MRVGYVETVRRKREHAELTTTIAARRRSLAQIQSQVDYFERALKKPGIPYVERVALDNRLSAAVKERDGLAREIPGLEAQADALMRKTLRDEP